MKDEMSINKERLRATLERDEGLNLQRHEVQEVDHIGYGVNLEEELPDELLQYLGVEDENSIKEITQEQADYLLDYFVDRAEVDCVSLYGSRWEEFSPLRREVLINLSFNLGLPKLRAFRKMNAAIGDENWGEAAAQMLDSKAARQTGNRYRRLAKAFESNSPAYLELPDTYEVVEQGTILVDEGGDIMPYHTHIVQADDTDITSDLNTLLLEEAKKEYVLSTITTLSEANEVLAKLGNKVLVVTEYNPEKAGKLLNT